MAQNCYWENVTQTLSPYYSGFWGCTTLGFILPWILVILSRESSLRGPQNVGLSNNLWNKLWIVHYDPAVPSQHVHHYSPSRETKSWKSKKSGPEEQKVCRCVYTKLVLRVCCSSPDDWTSLSEGEYSPLEFESATTWQNTFFNTQTSWHCILIKFSLSNYNHFSLSSI